MRTYVRDRDLGRDHVHVHDHDPSGGCMSHGRGLARVRFRDHRDRQKGGEEICH
jgi:hypothetical protein